MVGFYYMYFQINHQLLYMIVTCQFTRAYHRLGKCCMTFLPELHCILHSIFCYYWYLICCMKVTNDKILPKFILLLMLLISSRYTAFAVHLYIKLIEIGWSASEYDWTKAADLPVNGQPFCLLICLPTLTMSK